MSRLIAAILLCAGFLTGTAGTATAGTASTATAGTAGTATAAAPAWAPAGTAKLHPGVQAYTNGAQCTANFVYTDSAGNVYLGYAAHCAGTGAATETNGCLAGSLPLGTKVDFVTGGSLISPGTKVGSGTLAYSSWLTMQSRNESDANACAYNDLGLVKVDPASVPDVNPSVPFWGGPTGVNTSGTVAGDKVYSYGNSSIRAGITELSPKTGLSLGATGNGWSHPVYTVTPGIPGDSGSAFLDGTGKALGTLSTLQLAPLPASNGVGDLNHELAYAQQHSGIGGLQLAAGTEPFSPVL